MCPLTSDFLSDKDMAALARDFGSISQHRYAPILLFLLHTRPASTAAEMNARFLTPPGTSVVRKDLMLLRTRGMVYKKRHDNKEVWSLSPHHRMTELLRCWETLSAVAPHRPGS